MSTYYVAGLPYSDELYHFGIKGQKWGVRRYQNPDGTLTAAGKARYGTVENFQKAQKAKKGGMSEATKKKLKTAAKVAGAAALTGAAAYGVYRLGKVTSDHQKYVDRNTEKKILNAIRQRDLLEKGLTDNFTNFKNHNENTRRLNELFNDKVSQIVKEGESLKKGSSFVQMMSNAREWRRLNK